VADYRNRKSSFPAGAVIACNALFNLVGLVDVALFLMLRRGLLLFEDDQDVNSNRPNHRIDSGTVMGALPDDRSSVASSRA
jgi:hypothetical protein